MSRTSGSRTSTTLRVQREGRVRDSRDPLLELCKRVFRDPRTQDRAAEFLEDVLDGYRNDEPVRTEDWDTYLKRWNVGRSSFYSMRNQLVGGGLVTVRDGEYRPSSLFSRDLRDMADWWEAQVDSSRG
ncbi:MAG: hypothetical protein MAG715_01321 [Methanonatronarchaeales archaeon]|nr:hypothetical protein [Methanonatronarchaeales archaeon]